MCALQCVKSYSMLLQFPILLYGYVRNYGCLCVNGMGSPLVGCVDLTEG